MLLIVFLANGVLQTLITPFTFGAALNSRPLFLLLTVVVGGLLAGIVGVTLAALVTAIVVHTNRLITSSRSPDRDEVDIERR
jgi:predicted PurR-regulated permease PerM